MKTEPTTEAAIIKETRQAAMIAGAAADLLSSQIAMEGLSAFDRQETEKVWLALHSLHGALLDSAYAMEEKQSGK
jgi:hypothetical protein